MGVGSPGTEGPGEAGGSVEPGVSSPGGVPGGSAPGGSVAPSPAVPVGVGVGVGVGEDELFELTFTFSVTVAAAWGARGEVALTRSLTVEPAALRGMGSLARSSSVAPLPSFTEQVARPVVGQTVNTGESRLGLLESRTVADPLPDLSDTQIANLSVLPAPADDCPLKGCTVMQTRVLG